MAKLMNSTDANFESQISGDKLTLVQYSGEWCSACKMALPAIERLADTLKDKVNFYYHDIDKEPSQPTREMLKAVPAFILYRSKKKIDQKMGFSNEKDMLEFIHSHL
jgi:thioredoxin-like negative regulator of GroEL|tara:strand:- start:354 stop:674 length:321 start_codon:yes stop_codon:yes gene_type:complete